MRSELFWIETRAAGRLAIMARPHADDWLEDEIASWRSEGVGAVVCLLEKGESKKLGLQREGDLCRRVGMEFISFPIADRDVPSSFDDTSELIRIILAHLSAGTTVAIHCHGGIGRSSLVAACTLTLLGRGPDEAFEKIARSRGVSVPETDAQRDWVAAFARDARRIDE